MRLIRVALLKIISSLIGGGERGTESLGNGLWRKKHEASQRRSLDLHIFSAPLNLSFVFVSILFAVLPNGHLENVI